MHPVSLSAFYNHLGQAYYLKSNLTFATWFFRLALMLDPGNFKARENFKFLGHFSPTDLKGKSRREILQLTPRFSDAQQALMEGRIYAGTSDLLKELSELKTAWESIPRLEEL